MKHFVMLMVLLCAAIAPAQEQKPVVPISPSARLAAAKMAYMKNGGGSDIPFNVIENGIEGWPRFVLVDSPEKADIIIEVDSVEDPNSLTVDSNDSFGHKSSKNTHEIDIVMIKLLVYDAHTHLGLWSASERPKGGFKDKTRDDNLVEAAEKLLSRFRDRLEPPPPPEASPSPKTK